MTPKFGLVLFDRLLSSVTLAAKGAGARDSVYTEAGPGPGHPEPHEEDSPWRPFASEAQSRALTVGTMRGGFSGRDGATVVYRLEEESSAFAFRSWEDPVLIRGWSAPEDGWGGGQSYTAFAAAVIAETGVIVVVAVDQATGDGQTWSFDPRTKTWTTLYDWDAGALDGLALPIGMAYDRDAGRLLLWSGYSADGARQQVAYSSADGGASWSTYSRAFTPDLGGSGWDTTGIYRPVIGTDLDWLMITEAIVNNQGDALHLVSSDRGVTWDKGPGTGDVALRWGQPFYGSAGFGHVSVDPFHGDRLVCLIAGTASAEFGTEIVIDDSVAFSAAWACVDYDGIVYAVARGGSGAATFGQLYAFRSTDGGLTWERYAWGVLDTGSSTRTFEPHLMVASQGQLHLIGTCVGSPQTDGTVQILTLGGWSQVAHGSGTTNYIRTPLHRFGYGVVDPDANSQSWTAGYVPIALPDNIGWSTDGTSGTASLVDAEPALHLSTTAGQAIDWYANPLKNAGYFAFEFEVKLRSTGNVTLATIGTAGDGIFVIGSLERSGDHGYSVYFDIGSDGIQLRDLGTIRETLLLDMTAQYVRVRVHATRGNATAWYSTDGGTMWTRWANNVTITDTGGTNDDRLVWGIGATQVGNCFWRLVGAGAGVDWQYGIDGPNAVGDSPADGPLGHNFGHPAPGRGASYPIPEGTADGEDLALLSATGGPTHTGELVDLPVFYDYGVDKADPILYPSPRRTWRTTDTADDAELVYDQGDNQQLWGGGVVALLVIGGPRLWVLERDDGSSGWETPLGTLDLAVGSGLTWTRIGRSVTPRSGTATISRRLAEGELVGGYMDLDGTARRIVRNSAGFWTDDTSQQQVRILLAGVDGSEAGNGTAGVLVAPGGILIAYLTTDTPRRYRRVSAAGGQTVPEGYYEAGVVAIGRVVGLGAPAWGQSSTLSLSRRYDLSSDGVSTAEQLGPPRRRLSRAWSEPAPMLELRTLAAAPVAIKAAGGVPFGTRFGQVDLPALVEQLESGALPCAFVDALPAATGTVIDRTLWAFGRLAGAEIGITQSNGTEGLDEALGVVGLELEELR